MHNAMKECNLYIEMMRKYLSDNPDSRIYLQACSAFVNNQYLGQLNKVKTFGGLIQRDEEWRVRSINMAIQEISYNQNLQ